MMPPTIGLRLARPAAPVKAGLTPVWVPLGLGKEDALGRTVIVVTVLVEDGAGPELPMAPAPGTTVLVYEGLGPLPLPLPGAEPEPGLPLDSAGEEPEPGAGPVAEPVLGFDPMPLPLGLEEPEPGREPGLDPGRAVEVALT